MPFLKYCVEFILQESANKSAVPTYAEYWMTDVPLKSYLIRFVEFGPLTLLLLSIIN